MGATVQVRLDKESEAALQQLVRDNGWTASQAVRNSLRRAAEKQKPKSRPRLIGIGMYDSGIGDLATNKKHMESFGVKSMGKGWARPEERGK
jgi:Arc/MetJ-type ribon-helix-helix transcriptional regulator